MRIGILALSLALAVDASSRTRYPAIFTSLGLTAEETGAIDAGRPVAKVLPWGTASEVYVFGAVHINGSPDVYLKAARDIKGLAAMPGYLGAGELRPDATIADLALPVFDGDDVSALKNCREGDCDVQLPSHSIESVRTEIDWTRPDLNRQINDWARPRVLDLLRAYQQGGNRSLGEYRDKRSPTRVGDQFNIMMQRASALPDVLPELRKYLLEYPNASLLGAESYFYWETVDFGLKPTTRINHGVIYRGIRDNRDFAAVAIKQLYATHYFHTALDLSVCVGDGNAGGNRGFYLLTIKGSQQDGLTGVKGSMLRRIAVERTRESLERALASIKGAVERASSNR